MRTRLLAAALLLGSATAASAATATFDDIPNTGTAIQTGTVTSGGLDFSGAHFHIVDSPDPRVVRNASSSYLAAEAAGNLGQPVTFGLTGGGLFTLNSVDVAELWLPNEPLNDFRDIVFLGLQQGGNILNLSYTLDGIRDGAGGVADFETLAFAGWSDLQSVTVYGSTARGSFGDFSIDNIVVNSITGAIPEPSTWAMLILGFGAVGATLRRRSHRLALA